MKNEEVSSWQDLMRVIEQFFDGSWIFRGVTKSSHKLIPSIGRPDARKKWPGSQRSIKYGPDDETKTLDMFKRQCVPFLTYQPNSDLEYLALAQHHGLPTRLLDWTESPLVGAYFAARQMGVGGIAALYATKSPRLVSRLESEDPFSIYEVRLYRPPHLSARIPAQRGVFTIHPKPTEPYKPEGMKILMSKELCRSVKLNLNTCAINQATLFPDLVGLSDNIRWLYKWGLFPN